MRHDVQARTVLDSESDHILFDQVRCESQSTASILHHQNDPLVAKIPRQAMGMAANENYMTSSRIDGCDETAPVRKAGDSVHTGT